MNRKKLAFVVVLLLVFSLAVPLFVIVRAPQEGIMIDTKYALQDSLASGVPVGGSMVVLSNGSSLVSYNYSTGESVKLSPNDTAKGLSNILLLSASTDLNYFVFRTISTPTSGLLAQALIAQGQQSTGGRWWLFDREKGLFTALDQDTTNAKIIEDQLYVLSNTNTKHHIRSYSFDLKFLSDITIPDANNFFVRGETYYIQNKDTLHSTTNGVSYTLISREITPLVASDKGIIGTTKGKELVIVPLAGGEKTIISEGISGVPVHSEQFIAFQKEGSEDRYYLYDIQSETQETVLISKDIGGVGDIGELLSVIDRSTFVISSGSRENYIIGSGIKPINQNDPLLLQQAPNP